MKKSPNDLKTYQAITLNNGLRVLLIHNNETDKCAAALAVNAGHFNDPKDRQGLAHFLEHMLFLGTEKFPNGSEYHQFINQHGGTNNAWTATEHTCFFFDIHHNHFEEALERFSQFFISPLLSDEFITKERQNIDAEFKLKLKDDIRRLYDVHKETINQKHPFSQFSVGNIDTLEDRKKVKIKDELQSLFDNYYCANYMTLAIEGPQPLSELKSLATKMFTDIKSTDKAIQPVKVPLYLPEHQSIKIKVCPVKDDHQLIISFAMDSIDKYYQDKPESILAYLLGHEGKGSILSQLKSKQWALGLTAGSGVNGSNFKDFNISISLTDKGEQHIDDIINVVFSYIKLLKSSKIAEHYYQEKQKIAELSFNYHEKKSPIDNVSQLVLNMQYYPCEDYIFGDYMMTGMSDNNINKLLSYLNVGNMRVIHISQKNSFSQTSFWYQVPYHIEPITKKQLSIWNNVSINNALSLPSKNPYIIGNPSIYKAKKSFVNPNIIIKDDGLTVWYKKDSIFNVPKGYIYLGIDSPISIASVKNIAMTRLFVDLYTDAVIEDNYDAELAGIHYHLYAHQGGVTLQLSGISENQDILLIRLLEKLKSHQVSIQHFKLFKHQLIKHWNNSDKSKSISQLFSTLSSMMQPNNPNSDALAQALTNVSYDEYKDFCQQLFNQTTIEVLIHGNWLDSHAEKISSSIKLAFKNNYKKENSVQCPIVDIKNSKTLLLPITLEDHDHASVIYTPLPDKDSLTIALTMVTSHLLSPLFFQEMRTEKQYGYLVGVGYIPINRYPGIAFYIQSPHTDAISLTKAMDEFINESLSMLENIKSNDWLHLKQGLASQLEEKDHNLRIKSQRFWAAICNKDEFFCNKKQLVDAVLSLEFKQIKDFIATMLMSNAQPDRVILFTKTDIKGHVIGKNEHLDMLNGELISKPDDFTKKSKRKF